MTRLIQVGLGPLGRVLLADYIDRDQGHLIAVVDPDPKLAGTSLANWVEGAPEGMKIHSSLEELASGGLLKQADAALVTTFSDLELCMDSFRGLLTSGIDVVSSCEELLYPWLRHPVLAQELHERGIRGNSRIVGSGINPGFLMDTLPIMASAMCRQIDRVRIERIQDASPRRIPFQRKIGATLSLDAFEQKVADGSLRHVGMGESIHFLAHYLGWEIDRWEETLEPVIAEQTLSCGLGTVQAGDVSGVRQVATAWVRDKPKLELLFQAAIGQTNPTDSIRIEGDPGIEMRIEGGVHGDVGTSAVMLHTLDALRSAEAGLHTMVTIRPPRWQAH
ncbi:MAG: hypothetical protein ACI841_000965 [Planctomycetota bacterium]|jgi:hypothetical protein